MSAHRCFLVLVLAIFSSSAFSEPMLPMATSPITTRAWKIHASTYENMVTTFHGEFSVNCPGGMHFVEAILFKLFVQPYRPIRLGATALAPIWGRTQAGPRYVYDLERTLCLPGSDGQDCAFVGELLVPIARGQHEYEAWLQAELTCQRPDGSTFTQVGRTRRAPAPSDDSFDSQAETQVELSYPRVVPFHPLEIP